MAALKKSQSMVKLLMHIVSDPCIPPKELKKKLNLSKYQYSRYMSDLKELIEIEYDESKRCYTFPCKHDDALLGDPESFKLFLVLLNSLTVRYKIRNSTTLSRLHHFLGVKDEIRTLSKSDQEMEHDDDEALRQCVSPLMTAIEMKQSVKIDYKQDENKEFSLKVDPLKLIHDGEWWYLLALYRSTKSRNQEQRYYKLQRIRKVEILSDRFKPPKTLDIVPLSVPWDFGSGSEEEVVIWFSSNVSRYIREKKFHHTMKIEDCGNNCIEMSVEVRSPEKMLPWILSFGSDAKVISPQHLIDKVKAGALAVAGLYP